LQATNDSMQRAAEEAAEAARRAAEEKLQQVPIL
jgi:hypothetical protein